PAALPSSRPAPTSAKWPWSRTPAAMPPSAAPPRWTSSPSPSATSACSPRTSPACTRAWRASSMNELSPLEEQRAEEDPDRHGRVTGDEMDRVVHRALELEAEEPAVSAGDRRRERHEAAHVSAAVEDPPEENDEERETARIGEAAEGEARIGEEADLD